MLKLKQCVTNILNEEALVNLGSTENINMQ